MRKNKKIFAAVLLLLLFCANFVGVTINFGIDKVSAYFSVFSYPDEFDENNMPFSTFNYDRLSEVEKKAYICILNNISSHPSYIKIPKINSNEFENVYFAVKNDNPNLLCFSDSCNMYYYRSFSLLSINYDFSSDECEIMQKQMLDKADIILYEMPDFNSDFDKELYLHDYIANNCVYEENSLGSSAYGCLIENKAVCSGYSRALMLLLNKANVKSMLVGGIGKSSSRGDVSHLWNIVWIENEPYHVDVTWDDPGSSNDSSINHLYFNLTDSEISVNHVDYNLDFVCDSVKYNYFRYNDLFFSSYDKNDLDHIKKRLVDNINTGVNSIEIRFENDNDYNLASEALINSTSASSDMYKIIGYVTENVSDKVDVSHVSVAKDNNKQYIKLVFDWK